MRRRLSLLSGAALLAVGLFLTAADAHEGGGGGHGGGHGGYHGGYHGGGARYGGFYYPHHPYANYGPYRPGLYAPYGYYRPYYGYGFYGPGLGFGGLGLGGLGLGGLGLGGYGLGGYGLGGYGLYQPYYGGVVASPTVVVAPPGGLAAAMAPPGGTAVPPAGAGLPPQTPPPPDNAAHLQLVVPDNAEVLFDGGKTTQTGTTREFLSPQLPPGKLFDYTITVRYNDANGKAVTDKRVIHVRANDWFRIDFTRPAPPEPLPAP